MYNTPYNPPARLSSNFLRKHPEISNNSLFAYLIVLLKRLPNETCKRDFIATLKATVEEYKEDVDLELIGFPGDFHTILLNNI